MRQIATLLLTIALYGLSAVEGSATLLTITLILPSASVNVWTPGGNTTAYGQRDVTFTVSGDITNVVSLANGKSAKMVGPVTIIVPGVASIQLDSPQTGVTTLRPDGRLGCGVDQCLLVLLGQDAEGPTQWVSAYGPSLLDYALATPLGPAQVRTQTGNRSLPPYVALLLPMGDGSYLSVQGSSSQGVLEVRVSDVAAEPVPTLSLVPLFALSVLICFSATWSSLRGRAR